jgi:hypothetical protein
LHIVKIYSVHIIVFFLYCLYLHLFPDLLQWCGMVQNFRLTGENVTFLDVIGTNFAQLDIHCDQLDSLKLNGVCTQPKHTVSLR